MAKDTFLNRKITLNSKGKLMKPDCPCVMGVLNLTPDSFYAASRVQSADTILHQARSFLDAGAQIIDLGAYSSRPGAAHISETEEASRLLPAVAMLSREFPEAILSVDTFRAGVAEAAITAGAHIINDISAGTLDENMPGVVAKLNVPYIMMHIQGTPQNMQDNPVYEDITAEVTAYFEERISLFIQAGVKRGQLLIDPGFGFGKTVTHNYELLNKLESLQAFKLPLVAGFSRKSMITKVLHIPSAEALNGTSVLNTLALTKGVAILRVHDVKEAVECIKLVEKMWYPEK